VKINENFYNIIAGLSSLSGCATMPYHSYYHDDYQRGVIDAVQVNENEITTN
jgi:hypothetical protein